MTTHRWALLAGVVTLVLVFALSFSIDWDLGQRRNQKSAFIRIRYLRASLQSYNDKRGGYPRRLEDLHDEFLTTFVNGDDLHDRDFAESTWHGITDPEHTWGYVYDYASFEDTAYGAQHYELRASPVMRGRTGFRSFYVSDTSTIRWNDEQRASSTDPEPDIDPILDVHSYWGERLRRVSSSR